MTRSSEFLAAFRENGEPLPLRAFKPKDAPDTPENRPRKWTTTLFELTQNYALQQELRAKNQHCGIYYVVNVGGDTDASITRYAAFFAESDNRSISEQHAALDSAPIQPSIRVETRASVHAYWLIAGECVESEWRDAQERLISYFDSDPKIKNPARVMRLPGFYHLHLNGHGLSRKRVEVHTFEPERKYTVAEMRDAFPAPPPENVPQGQQTPVRGTFEHHEGRHEELCQRIMAHGKRNGKGNWDARCPAHNGTGEKGLVYFPSSGAVKCNAEPPCDYFAILRAEGLPDGHLASRDSSASRVTADYHAEDNSEQRSVLRVVCMDDVKPEKVSWLWLPFIPMRKLTLLEGEEGLGKSYLTCAIACALSHGRGLPGCEPFPPANVLIMSSEDGLGDTVRPRLEAMGANLKRIFAVDQPLTLDEKGMLLLEEAVIEYQPSMVVVDPLFSYVGARIDINRANESRAVSARLAALAEKHNLAFLLIRHIGKMKGNGDPRAAGLGSIDWRAAARSVMLAGCDRETNERGVVQTKHNLTPPTAQPVGFEIKPGATSDAVGEFAWKTSCTLTAGQILASVKDDDERRAQTDAAAVLRDLLQGGSKSAKEAQQEMRAAGFNDNQTRYARERLGIRPRKEGFGNERSRWMWQLPTLEDGNEDVNKMNFPILRQTMPIKALTATT